MATEEDPPFGGKGNNRGGDLAAGAELSLRGEVCFLGGQRGETSTTPPKGT